MNKIKPFKSGYLLIGYLVFLLLMLNPIFSAGKQIPFFCGLFLLFLIPLSKISQFKSYRSYFFKSCSWILTFFFFYYIISNSNIGEYNRGLISFAIIGMHILCIYLIILESGFNSLTVVRNVFLFLSIFVVFIPHYLIVGNLDFGSFYNLVHSNLLTSTTVEAPLIVSILFILSMFDTIFNRKWSFINIFSIIFSVVLLLIFSRRGFIFSSLIALVFYQVCFKLNRKPIIYLAFLLLLLPMFWDLISVYLVELFKLEFVSSLVQRNDTSQIADATGRAITWANVLDLFFSFKSRFLFGYSGGPPENLFIQIVGEEGRYSHAHNTFLQLFLEGGYFTNILFLIMLIFAFRSYNQLRSLDKSTHNFYLVILIFFFALSATETLIRFQQFSNFIFCNALIGFNLMNLKIKQRVRYQQGISKRGDFQNA